MAILAVDTNCIGLFKQGARFGYLLSDHTVITLATVWQERIQKPNVARSMLGVKVHNAPLLLNDPYSTLNTPRVVVPDEITAKTGGIANELQKGMTELQKKKNLNDSKIAAHALAQEADYLVTNDLSRSQNLYDRAKRYAELNHLKTKVVTPDELEKTFPRP